MGDLRAEAVRRIMEAVVLEVEPFANEYDKMAVMRQVSLKITKGLELFDGGKIDVSDVTSEVFDAIDRVECLAEQQPKPHYSEAIRYLKTGLLWLRYG